MPIATPSRKLWKQSPAAAKSPSSALCATSTCARAHGHRGEPLCARGRHLSDLNPRGVAEECSAVVEAIGAALEPAVLEAAIVRVMEFVEERQEATRQRRSDIEDALRMVCIEEGRLIEAVKQGHGLEPLVTALHD